MERSFTITRAQVVTTDPASLKARLCSATDSERGAESILRSLERMGTDSTIRYFEISEVPRPGMPAGSTSGAWRVRADRGFEDGWGR